MSDFFKHETSICIDSDCAKNSKVYKNCYCRNIVLGENASIGDFSRIEDSRFEERCIIQRNNMIYSSSFGKYTYTGRNTTIWHSNIGKFCSISWNVSIGGANHDYKRITLHSFLYSDDFGIKPKGYVGYDRFSNPCVIGNDVWIAANACVLRGVKIGDGAVVAAGAVVTENVEPYTIVAGVPAKPIKKRFDDEIITLLNRSNWWNLPIDVIKEYYGIFNEVPSQDNLIKLIDICKKYNTFR